MICLAYNKCNEYCVEVMHQQAMVSLDHSCLKNKQNFTDTIKYSVYYNIDILIRNN